MWLMLPRGTVKGRRDWSCIGRDCIGFGGFADALAGRLDFAEHVLDSGRGDCDFRCGGDYFRNPIYCAIWFGLTLLGVAGLFLLSDAQFLAVATIVVYAGAILVTLLFVLMLAQPEGKASYDSVSWEALFSATAGMIMVGILSMTIGNVFGTSRPPDVEPIAVATADQLADGVLSPYHVASIGMELFGRHLIAIEVAGTLLLAALVGAAVIVVRAKHVIETLS